MLSPCPPYIDIRFRADSLMVNVSIVCFDMASAFEKEVVLRDPGAEFPIDKDADCALDGAAEAEGVTENS